jgi:hypothetical protein
MVESDDESELSTAEHESGTVDFPDNGPNSTLDLKSEPKEELPPGERPTVDQ